MGSQKVLPIQKRPVLTVVATNKFACVANTVDYDSISDADLVRACQRKDERALKHLIKRHERIIAGMVRRMAPERKDTHDDLMQEVYIRIWRSVGQLRNPDAFRAWLQQIVTNLFYDELRKRPRNFQIVSMDEPVVNDNGSEMGTRDIVDASPQPEDRLLTSELSEVLVEAVSKISEEFRTAAVLRDVEGLSYEEISQITGTELGTVKSRISRARNKIKDLVSPYLRDCA